MLFGLIKSKPAPRTPVRRRRSARDEIDTVAASVRSFAAAQVSRLIGEWTWDAGFSNGDLLSSLSQIRARARDMAKNSEYFARWLQLYVSNVVGPRGFLLKSLPEVSADDFTVDSAAAYFIETHWAKWAKRPEFCDVQRRNSLASIFRLAVDNLARDGEAFIQIVPDSNPYGVALRPIRPDCIDETINWDLGNGNVIRCGIEVEKTTWRRVAYWMDTSKADEHWQTLYIEGRWRARIPAEQMVHLYVQHDAQQLRGVSLSHPFLRKLKMLDQYDESELAAAKDEVNTLGVFTAPAGREGEIKNLADSKNRDRLEAKSEPGSRLVLPQGWTYDPKHPNHPNAGQPMFKASMLRDVASGGGVEYANFANDWGGVSYSSVRAGTLSERDWWTTLQEEFIEKIVDPVFAAWLRAFLTYPVSGGTYSLADYDRLLPHEFRGRRWAWVDPMKDVAAAEVAVRHGWKTDAQVAADYDCDIDDNLVEAARVAKAREALGLPPDFDGKANNADVKEKDVNENQE